MAWPALTSSRADPISIGFYRVYRVSCRPAGRSNYRMMRRRISLRLVETAAVRSTVSSALGQRIESFDTRLYANSHANESAGLHFSDGFRRVQVTAIFATENK